MIGYLKASDFSEKIKAKVDTALEMAGGEAVRVELSGVYGEGSHPPSFGSGQQSFYGPVVS